MEFRGIYNETLVYNVGDVVRYENHVWYKLLRPCPAGTDPTNTLYWARAAANVAEAAELIQDSADATGSIMEAVERAVVAADQAARVAAEATETMESIADSIPSDYSEMSDLQLLLADNIQNTVQTISYGDDGNVSQIAHMRDEAAIRTDSFEFSDTTITETRTLNSGSTLIIVTDMDTLVTTTTYTKAN